MEKIDNALALVREGMEPEEILEAAANPQQWWDDASPDARRRVARQVMPAAANAVMHVVWSDLTSDQQSKLAGAL
jgi:hypothetical protein